MFGTNSAPHVAAVQSSRPVATDCGYFAESTCNYRVVGKRLRHGPRLFPEGP